MGGKWSAADSLSGYPDTKVDLAAFPRAPQVGLLLLEDDVGDVGPWDGHVQQSP